MGWPNISSGRRYDSSSDHIFMVGGIINGIIAMVLYYRAFRKCDAAEKRGEVAEKHYFSKNFKGGYKIMEASAILKMVEDAFYNRFLSLMSSSSTMTAQCELCSSIHPKVNKDKF